MSPDQDIYQKQGFGNALALKAPFGLLIVDFVNGFADPLTFGGGNIAPAIERTHGLLMAARDRSWPVAHTRVVYQDDGADATIMALKVPSLLTLREHAPESQIVSQLEPISGELVLRKTNPSAFFGTSLAAWLSQRGVKTLLIAGCTTSGCVRASVVDAMCHGFRPLVVTDCVGDRSLQAHEANLFDMKQKYATSMPRDVALEATSTKEQSVSP
ncbi:Maleamate amidohydrolase [Bordetella tumbae]|uniref:isochorismatase family protein n=1 Tax=Bordetella tumbae TaxID=1649139 RepID=UPI0039EE2A62